MDISQNICPVCQESNKLGAIICGHCGTALEDLFMYPGVKTQKTDLPVPDSLKGWSIDEAAVPDKGIAVYLEGESNPVYIDSKGEFVIGRRAETTASVPEGMFDLSPMGGYARGISRRHVIIRLTEYGYEILDLGSVNGTWLHNARLVPHKYYPLASGSHLRLGSMRLFVVYQPLAETKQRP